MGDISVERSSMLGHGQPPMARSGSSGPPELQIPPVSSPPASSVSSPLDAFVRRSGGGGSHASHADDASQQGPEVGIAYLPQSVYLCDPRHDAGEASTSGLQQETGMVSKWRMKDRMKTSNVALVLCLNIGVDPPDVIKISPCARMECWIDPLSMQAQKALDLIGKNLQIQYERWQPRARYKMQLDPTVEEVKKLATSCRRNAKTERVLFHYNGHGVPRPTANGEVWLFNKSYTQYIPLSVYELESWLGTPSIYVFDCSAAGMIVNSFCERPEWGHGSSALPAMKDCIILAACGAEEILPQNAELPADVFTACLTTPIKIALRWFCSRSLLSDSLNPDDIDNIPGRQNDRKTLLGELNWIFTAITDTIAWNVLPRELFQRLFRQDLLVASLFRNFLLAERIMRAANCNPLSYPRLPPTHQHPMWQAWDMAAEICLAQLPALLKDPTAEFQPSPFFTEQLTAFEVWLEHGSERKKPPEQLPIVLQVLLSQSHRLRALVLLGRFLDMGAWAVDLALSVGIFPYVLKLLQTTAAELRQILVFIWTKILALDKSCQVDLVKDGGHLYFIKFLDSPDIYAEQRAMAAFVLAVIADSHPKGQLACIQAGLIVVCLNLLQTPPPTEPLLLQWLCLCLGKLWDGAPSAHTMAIAADAPRVLGQLLLEPQPEVRAAAMYALGTLILVAPPLGERAAEGGATAAEGPSSAGPLSPPASETDEAEDDGRLAAERDVARLFFPALGDGSPLVRAELAIALARLAQGHNRLLRRAAAAYLKPPSHSIVTPHSTLSHPPRPFSSYSYSTLGFSLGGGSGGGGVGGSSPSNILAAAAAAAGSALSSPSTPPQPRPPGPGRAASSSAPMQSPLLRNHSLDNLSAAATSSARQENGATTPDRIAENGRVRGGAYFKKETAPLVEDGGIYSQAMMAIYALARDPSPRVASLARQTLRMVGIEVPAPGGGEGGLAGGLSPAAVGAALLNRDKSWHGPLTSPLPRLGLSRTASWIPPLSGGGMRRVASSMDFMPSSAAAAAASGHLARPSPPGASEVGSRGRGAEAAPAGEQPSTSGRGEFLGAPLPKSTLYSWSCGHFSRPLLEVSGEAEEEALVRREERERMALDGISACHHSCVSKVSDQIASCDTEADMTKALLLHPFVPVVCIADEQETIRVWNYEEGVTVNQFQNNVSLQDRGVTKMCLLNELDESLLLVASSDGAVKVWRGFAEQGEQRLASAWQAVVGHKPGAKGNAAVVDWQQISGYLYASGEVSTVSVWDLDRELLAFSAPTQTESTISAMAASQTHVGQLMAGCRDGSVRLFDMRMHGRVVCTAKPHTQRVVGVDFQPGTDPVKVVCASGGGDIKLLDLRRGGATYLSIDAHKGYMTSLAVHRHAPVMASGSAKQYIKVFDMAGKQLSMVRYHNSFLGQKIGPVSCLAFHPYSVLLAAGATDSMVSIYAGESCRPRS